MRENEEFIRFCGQLVFGDGVDAWKHLTESQREAHCAEAQKTGWDLLFFSFLGEHLPEPYRQTFKKRHQIETIKRLMEERDLTDFYRFLEGEKIPFVPLKGADLAFRLYADSALRTHSDWDILFRKEDCPTVLRLLQERGWRTPSGCVPGKPLHHHYEEMHNGRHWLEVHHTLPNFGNAAAAEIWQQTEKISEYHRVLTPEMNLLLLTAHACVGFYGRVATSKILMDAAQILKRDAVDWNKVHRLADRWGILRPDLLLNVWRDFFPEGILPSEDASFAEQQKLIREIMATREVAQRAPRHERAMASANRDLRWLKRVFAFYNRATICQHYHLDPHQTGKIVWCGIRDFCGKIWYFLTHSRSDNPELRSFGQKIAKLEKSIRCQPSEQSQK